MGNHLESLICQYYEWKGWFVKSNIKVGRLGHGGYTGEIDVIVYNPETDELIHYEPSTDATKWEKRELRYRRKFDLGQKHFSKISPQLSSKIKLRQIAVFFNVPSHRKSFLGVEAMSIDELVKMVRNDVEKCGRVGRNAIPEKYDLLRTIQLVVCGYVKPL